MFAAAVGGGVVALGLAAAMRVGSPNAYAAGNNVMRAQGIELDDAAGKKRAELVVQPDGSPFLRLFDISGQVRLGLGVLHDGSPMVALLDASGRAQASLSVLPGDGARLRLFDSAGQHRASFVVGPDGSPVLVLLDATENVLTLLGLTDGNSILNMGSASNKAGARLSVSPNGNSSLKLIDVTGEDRAYLSVNGKDHSATLKLPDPKDRDGGVVLMMDPASGPFLALSAPSVGDTMAMLGIGLDGTTHLSMEENGHQRASLGLIPREAALLVLSDATGQMRIALKGNPTGPSGMEWFDATGELIRTLGF